jgi:magnesium chelatase family protein
MNPCPCGFAGDPQKQCRCTAGQAQRYRQRVSGPFLDRLDIRIELGRSDLSIDDLIGGSGAPETGAAGEAGSIETSASVRERVCRAIDLQLDRSGTLNARLGSAANHHWCRPDKQGRVLLEAAASRFGMSARACNRCLRVARTIADLDQSDPVRSHHIAEALTLRKE